jgi:hypothetical protein
MDFFFGGNMTSQPSARTRPSRFSIVGGFVKAVRRV